MSNITPLSIATIALTSISLNEGDSDMQNSLIKASPADTFSVNDADVVEIGDASIYPTPFIAGSAISINDLMLVLDFVP